MATQSSARLKGDDYQHLLSWYHILSLLKPSYYVEKVKLEDSLAGLVDDVTVYRGGKEPAVDFYQIKFHVDQRESYSIDNLIKSAAGKSIMEKFWASWKKIKNDYPGRRITLNLHKGDRLPDVNMGYRSISRWNQQRPLPDTIKPPDNQKVFVFIFFPHPFFK